MNLLIKLPKQKKNKRWNALEDRKVSEKKFKILYEIQKHEEKTKKLDLNESSQNIHQIIEKENMSIFVPTKKTDNRKQKKLDR